MSWGPFLVCLLSLALVFAVIFHETPRKSKHHKSVPSPKKWHRNRRSIPNQGKAWKRDLSSLSIDVTEFTSSVMIKLERLDSRISELEESINEIKFNFQKLTENCYGIEIQMERMENETDRRMKVEDQLQNETTSTPATEASQMERVANETDTQMKVEDQLQNETSTPATEASQTAMPTNTSSISTTPTLQSPILCIRTSIQEMDIENTSSLIENETCTLETDLIYHDCKSATQNQYSGNYLIKWPFSSEASQVYCDQQWLVIQRRHFGNQTFKKGWQSYKNGFGSSCEDFWIGNELLHNLTSNNSWSLMVEFRNTAGYVVKTVLYKSFRIASEKKNFTLYVDGFQSGNGKDGLSFHNDSQFVTPDHGLNDFSIRCSILEESGWWFAHTQYLHFTTCNHHLLGSNLNAPYIKNYKIESKFLLSCTNTTRQWHSFKFSNSLYWRGETLEKDEFSKIEMKIKMN